MERCKEINSVDSFDYFESGELGEGSKERVTRKKCTAGKSLKTILTDGQESLRQTEWRKESRFVVGEVVTQ